MRRSLLLAGAFGICAGLIVLAAGVMHPRLHPTDGGWAPIAAASSNFPKIEDGTCWFPLRKGRQARCGTLTVLENYGDPASRRLRLKFVVFLAARPSARELPLFYVSGGPGDPAEIDAGMIDRWWDWTGNADWLRSRDVVVFDQRGVGVSEPAMTCPELAETGYRLFPEPFDPAQEKIWAQAARHCHDRLIGSGLDLSQYNTATIVEDLNALITAMGFRAWDIFAVSYGTRVALQFVRRYPTGTRAVILDSVDPPNVRTYVDSASNAARAFGRLFAACAIDSGCKAAFPNLAARFDRLVARTAKQPVLIKVPAPNGSTLTVKVDDAKLIEILFYALYERRSLLKIPRVLDALDQGDPTPLIPLAAAALETYVSQNESHGLFLSVECHDDFPFNPLAMISDASKLVPRFKSFAMNNLPLMACPAWSFADSGAHAPADHRPVASDLPVLIFAGDLDPVSSPDWVKGLGAHLPHAAIVNFGASGHGVVSGHACADRLIARFLIKPGEVPYDDCLLAVAAPHFEIR